MAEKYFINALAINPYFKGEVILTDNFIHVDYYEMYYATNKSPLNLWVEHEWASLRLREHRLYRTFFGEVSRS